MYVYVCTVSLCVVYSFVEFTYLVLCCLCFLSSSVSSHVELKFERYKFIVQVVIGEQRGEGVKYVGLRAQATPPVYSLLLFE